jgi:hypothetical protein
MEKTVHTKGSRWWGDDHTRVGVKKGTRRLQQCADADQILRVFLSGAAMTQPLGPFFFVFLQFLGYPPRKESPTLSLRRKHGHTHTHTHT